MGPGRSSRWIAPLLYALLSSVLVFSADPGSASADIKALLKAGKYAEADAAARALLAEVETGSGADSLETAKVLDMLVEALGGEGKGREPETRKIAERAVAIREKVQGPDHLDVATSRNNLANVIADSGDNAAALPLYESVLAIREKALGPEHPAVATSLTNLGIVHKDMLDFAGALQLYERGLAIREKALGPDHPAVAVSLFCIGNVFLITGDYAAARPVFERALAIREKALGPDHPHLTASLNNLAIVRALSGDYAAARPLYERALAIREKALGPDHPDVAESLNNVAILLQDTGDYASARPLLERALAVREKAFGPEDPLVGMSLNNLGVLLRKAGDDAAARPLLERSLSVREKALGPDHPDVAESQNNLGGLLGDAGEYAAARALFERALATREKTFGPDHPDVAQSLDNLAALFARTGDYASARPLLERALAIRQKALGPAHPNVALSFDRLGRLLAIQGETPRAFGDAIEAERIAREHLQSTSRSLSEQQALRYASVRTTGLDLALTLSARGLDDASRRQALDGLVRSRAVVLDEMATRHREVSGAVDPEVARLAAALSSARVRLANLVVRGVGDHTPETYRRLLDEAREERERAERALAGASAGFARELSRSRLGLDEVIASLPPGSAVVSFTEYGKIPLGSTPPEKPSGKRRKKDVPSYLAFVLRSGERAPRVVDLGPAEEMDRLVASFREEIARGGSSAGPASQGAEASYREAGARLRRKLWDPVVSALGEAERVFVVPDGTLNLVNIAVLPRDEGGYLVEQAPLVHYVSAERDLVPSDEPLRGRGLLVLGAPSYDATSLFASLKEKGGQGPQGGPAATYRGQRTACRDFASVRFSPLPATGQESSEIARLWEKYSGQGATAPAASSDPVHAEVRDLRDSAASEAELKRSAPGRRVLHIATHGFFLGGACASALDSTRGIGGLAPEPAADTIETLPLASGENPLLLSGLVLAGANHRSAAGEGEDDGILTAEEIASLDLSGVEWVVLSACETGVGVVRAGEGVFGLRRAFQVAGARTLIMSLWPAEDEATRAWMKAFYEARLRDGLDTAESARRASTEMLEERRKHHRPTHPFFWGAFVAAGG